MQILPLPMVVLQLPISTVDDYQKNKTKSYTAIQSRAPHPSVIYQTNEEAIGHVHGLVCLSWFVETYLEQFGSSLSTWPQGPGPQTGQRGT